MQTNKIKKALISGITGQDGAYLADFLLKRGYEVHGIKRRCSLFNTQRVDHLYTDLHNPDTRFFLHFGDLTDSTNILRIVQDVQPDEIYNLAAQSHVQVSFETPEYTANADAIGTLRLLEAIRILKKTNDIKFYQASTSELFGNASRVPQNENTPFHPRSPYGAAKLYAYWITVNYREAYGIHACNGILFNHESPLRGETFVTRKITRSVARILHELDDCLYLGNLDAKRDWGHAKEYVEGMWNIMMHKNPADFVLATGKATTVRDFAKMAFRVGGIDLEFKGEGADEIGFCTKTNRTLIKIDHKYFRPTEVDYLLGNANRAHEAFGWEPKISVEELCREMVSADIYRTEREIAQNKNHHISCEEKVFTTGFNQTTLD